MHIYIMTPPSKIQADSK